MSQKATKRPHVNRARRNSSSRKRSISAGEALFETADSLDLPETMADDDCDGLAHGNY